MRAHLTLKHLLKQVYPIGIFVIMSGEKNFARKKRRCNWVTERQRDKIKRCVEQLKDKGYPEDSAYPICISSVTGTTHSSRYKSSGYTYSDLTDDNEKVQSKKSDDKQSKNKTQGHQISSFIPIV